MQIWKEGAVLSGSGGVYVSYDIFQVVLFSPSHVTHHRNPAHLKDNKLWLSYMKHVDIFTATEKIFTP